MAIVTTKVVKNEQITRNAKKLSQVTTKDVEVKYVDKPIGKRDDGTPIFEAPKGEIITTHNVDGIAEKNKRAQVMVEKEALAWPEDVLIGVFDGEDEPVGLLDRDWKREPVRGKKR